MVFKFNKIIFYINILSFTVFLSSWKILDFIWEGAEKVLEFSLIVLHVAQKKLFQFICQYIFTKVNKTKCSPVLCRHVCIALHTWNFLCIVYLETSHYYKSAVY